MKSQVVMIKVEQRTTIAEVWRHWSFCQRSPLNTVDNNPPRPNPVAANAEINIPWTLPIRQDLMTDMMKRQLTLR